VDAKWTHDPHFAKKSSFFISFLCFTTEKPHVKCILQSFLLILLSGGFTVAILIFIFHFLLIFLPNMQKVAKNEIEKEPKSSQKWLL
jgi:hypothetical protein